jgi:hypothetical protein
MSGRPPLYARVLRLRHIRPGGLLCFAFFEGAVPSASCWRSPNWPVVGRP